MSKRKKGVLPRLRFPEFRDAGPWEIKPLGELLVGPPEYGINAPAVPYSECLPTYLRITDIAGDGSGIREEKVSVARNVSKENYLCEGDIVLARTGASVGKSYKYKKENGPLVFAGFLIRIRPNRDKLNDEFLYQYFFTEQYWRWVSHTSARSGQPGINSSEYASLPLPMPLSSPEQQKIADYLSSWDEVIDLEGQKLDALNAHKKGLMQQLFPCEGETIPRLRFPEFRDAGEWEVKQLGEVCQMTAGEFVAASKIKEATADNLYPCYGGNGLRGFTETFTHEGIYPLIGRQGALCGNITLAKGKFHATEHAIVAAPRKNTVINWLYYQLVRLNLNQFATGQAQPGLSVANLNGVPVAIPKEEYEQQKIADCLSSLDEVIDLEAQKLEELKAHKKGLMQQLFPQEVD